MIKYILSAIAIIGLIPAGCVRIPVEHGTAGHYHGTAAVRTECIAAESIPPLDAAAPARQADTLNAGEFRILNWNSYKGSNEIWQEDFAQLSSRSDLVVLQEGYLTDDLRDLLDSRQYSWDIAKAFTYNDIYTGVLTASRVEPDFLCSFRAPEPLTRIPKTVLITRYPLSGTDAYLVIANIHMINFSFAISAYREQLEKIAAAVSQHRGPLIISGDFNSWNRARQRVLTEIMQELGMREVVFETDHRATFLGRRVDHIFYRQLVPIEALTEAVKTSDHNPMLVTFRLADNE